MTDSLSPRAFLESVIPRFILMRLTPGYSPKGRVGAGAPVVVGTGSLFEKVDRP